LQIGFLFFSEDTKHVITAVTLGAYVRKSDSNVTYFDTSIKQGLKQRRFRQASPRKVIILDTILFHNTTLTLINMDTCTITITNLTIFFIKEWLMWHYLVTQQSHLSTLESNGNIIFCLELDPVDIKEHDCVAKYSSSCAFSWPKLWVWLKEDKFGISTFRNMKKLGLDIHNNWHVDL